MRVPVLLLLCLQSPVLLAESLLEQIRAYDLNDYAFGATFSTSPSLYKGADDSYLLYPYLTSVQEQDLTDDWFLVGEGDVGFRYVQGDWTFGAVGIVQTLGFDKSKELSGINQRKWALEMAPVLQFRKLPVKMTFKPYFEVTDRHSGYVSQLEFSYPTQHPWGYLTPAIEFEYQSADYTDYYFGVTPAEASAPLPVYETDSALNTSLKLTWAYYLSDHWIVSGRAVWGWLDDVVVDSPLVDRDADWSLSVGLAYNADFFRPSAGNPARHDDRLKLRLTTLQSRINTEYVRDATDGTPGARVDMEDLLGLSDQETVYQIDGVYRFHYYHRVEVSYAETSRSATKNISRSFAYGDTTYDTGSEVKTSLELDTFRFSYGYSLIRDDQKELGLSVGLHRTAFQTELILADGSLREISDPDPTLPTVGVFGSVALGERARVEADVQYFGMELDRYDGSMIFARLALLYRFGIAELGVGYNYYMMNIDSEANDHTGSLKFTHQGPTASVSFGF